MPSDAHHEALLAYWRVTGGGALPALPDNPADAAAVALRARPRDTWACAFGRITLDDPWPSMAVRDTSESWDEAVWAITCADLVPVAEADDGSVLVIDRAPDPRGEHQAFFVTREGEVVGPWFASTASLLEWAATLTDDDDEPGELDRDPPPRDLWNRSALSAVGSLAALQLLSPARFYRAWRGAQWPESKIDTGAPKAGDPSRVNLLRVLARFAKTRAVVLPSELDEASFTPAQRTLLDRLRDLERSVSTGEPPGYVTSLKTAAGAVGAAAAAWLARYEAARAPAPKGVPDEKFREAHDAIDRFLAALEADEAIEIEEGERADLVEEVLAVMMNAPNANAALRMAVEAITESSHVGEVYADDTKLLRALRKALGG